MTQRVVLLTDEDIDRLIGWYDYIAEDGEAEDEALMTFLREHHLT